MACGETNDSRLSGGDSPVLIGKDYLSVLPATIQVGNFPGIFKLNIATNLVWSASTEEDWIELPKQKAERNIICRIYC